MTPDLNYITILKKNYPRVAVKSYSDPAVYSSIQFSANGEAIPTQAELDSAITLESFGAFEVNTGKILKTYFIPVGIFSGNSNIMFSNSAPSITDGSQIASATLTPVSIYSKFSFSSSFILDCSSNNKNLIVALFRGNTCIFSTSVELASTGKLTTMSLEFVDTPGVTTPVTYSMRVGVSSSATWYVNQSVDGYSNGNTTKSYLKISEYS